ncbi:MAG TPA: DUF302 domain-containing protein [Candidatus Polarisedimenticolia bacterium]|nr:DUF302 domain-containing protein [Candidatus Polarisedimenticolia bacterium]
MDLQKERGDPDGLNNSPMGSFEPSNHSVDDTVGRLKAMVQASGAVLFGLINHSGEAEKVGLEMKPLMLASPSTAIDLPLKMLFWEDAAKRVWISYKSPEYLQERHLFPEELLSNTSVLRKLASGVAQ